MEHSEKRKLEKQEVASSKKCKLAEDDIFLWDISKIDLEDTPSVYDICKILESLNLVEKVAFSTREEAEKFLIGLISKVMRIINDASGDKIIVKTYSSEVGGFIYDIIRLKKWDFGQMFVYYKKQFNSSTSKGEVVVLERKLPIMHVMKKYRGSLGVKGVNWIPCHPWWTEERIPKILEDGVFNLFVPFKAKKVPTEEIDRDCIQIWIQYFLEVWANGNIFIHSFLLDYLAYCFQNPDKPSEIMLILYGTNEESKSFPITEFIMPYIYGNDKTKQFSEMKRMMKYPGDIEHCCLAYIDDNERTGISTSAEWIDVCIQLRSIITPGSCGINYTYHGKSSKSGLCFCNFILGSSHMHSFPTGGEQWDRRVFHIQVNDYVDLAFMDKIRPSCNQTTANHFFSWLLERKVSRETLHEKKIAQRTLGLIL